MCFLDDLKRYFLASDLIKGSVYCAIRALPQLALLIIRVILKAVLKLDLLPLPELARFLQSLNQRYALLHILQIEQPLGSIANFELYRAGVISDD